MDGLDQDALREPLGVDERVLERYRVTQRLAAGGHSVVYRGEDERLARPVCIKVFHKLAESGVWRTSYDHFVQEAFALSKLTHPNTLRIYDFGYLDGDGAAPGAPFQVSEFMNGGTLSRRVRLEGPVAAVEAAAIAAALGAALAEAHGLGILHRDIKPKNILFGTAGPNRVPKLADFGIAKVIDAAMEERHRAGDTHAVAGAPVLMYSPSWAAPEQIVGEPVGPAADVYSLALVIIFMLTGQVVFAAEDSAEAHRVRADSDARVADALRGARLPAAAVALLQRACRFHPGERPAPIGGFTDELAAALSARPARLDSPPLAALAGDVSDDLPALPPRRLAPAGGDQPVGDRRVRFVPAPDGSADIETAGGRVRLRLTFLPGVGGRLTLHIKGLNCFVARVDGRPSPAIQLDDDDGVVLCAPDRKLLAEATASFGSPAAGHTLFHLGGDAIAVATDDCPRVVALDFGPGAESLLLFTPPPPPAGARRRPRT
ncbi:MAG TPA: serine/threonine-protein kinase [Kofleriaceae bacterium]|nr:serine/threonine-protein kinase [Kofleriaceae bacterium]